MPDNGDWAEYKALVLKLLERCEMTSAANAEQITRLRLAINKLNERHISSEEQLHEKAKELKDEFKEIIDSVETNEDRLTIIEQQIKSIFKQIQKPEIPIATNKSPKTIVLLIGIISTLAAIGSKLVDVIVELIKMLVG